MSLLTGLLGAGGGILGSFGVVMIVTAVASFALVVGYQIDQYADTYAGYLTDENFLRVTQTLRFTVPAAHRADFFAELTREIGERRPDWFLRAPHCPAAGVGAYTEASRGFSRAWTNFRVHAVMDAHGHVTVTSTPTQPWVLFDGGTSVEHVLLFRRAGRALGAELPPLPGDGTAVLA